MCGLLQPWVPGVTKVQSVTMGVATIRFCVEATLTLASCPGQPVSCFILGKTSPADADTRQLPVRITSLLSVYL